MSDPLVIYAPSWIGQVDVSSGLLKIGDLGVYDTDGGYPMANVFVERTSGGERIRNGVRSEIEGFPISRIIIEIIGDYTAQQALDAENAEAELYPGGPKEYWRSKGVSEEDLADWDDGDYPEQRPRCPWRG